MNTRAAQFLLGLAVGAALSLLISIGTVGFVAWVVAGVVIGIRSPRFAMLSGALMGLGAVICILTLNHITTCAATDDFCGRSNPWPLLVSSLAAIAAGIFFGALTWGRTQRV